MRRPTLQMAINAGAGLPVGLCLENLSDSAAIINLAQERLIMDELAPDEGWWGGWVTMIFNVIATNLFAYFVTPAEIARVIVQDVCQKPVRIQNGFFEYLQFSRGLQPRACEPQGCGPATMQAFERDSVFTLNPFAATPQKLRVFVSNPADVGKRIVFQGFDNNGVTILDTDPQTQAAILGETVFLANPFATAKNTFSAITGILKDPTNGPIQVFMIDPVSGASLALTTMNPNETTAQYRRYLVTGLPCGCCSSVSTGTGQIQITAQCKFDFIPATSPTDYLIIPNIPAILEEVQSIRYSRMDSPSAEKYEAKHHAKAISLLNGQLDVYEGKINTAIKVPLFGSDRLRPQPI